jgi:hypothetical protein
MSTENQKWDVIFTYTTGEAVEDGSLILVDEKISKQAAINYPVYLTQAVFARYFQVPRELKGLQDESGRSWVQIPPSPLEFCSFNPRGNLTASHNKENICVVKRHSV